MGRQPLRRGRRIDGREMTAEADALFARLGVRIDPGRIARGLSIADQQLVEIAKALSLNARVIVMDEPTAALSAVEVARLFDVISALRADGAAVLFISHRLDEVFEICQRVTVMRDGRHVLTSPLAGLSTGDLVRAMVGRDMPERVAGERGAPGQVQLAVQRLTREGVFTDVSFEVRAGEIVALAGLVGAGRSEVARAIFGIDRYDAGSVTAGSRRLPEGIADRGHDRRDRPGPGGPAPAGPGHGDVHPAERGPGLAGRAAQGRDHPRVRGAQLRRRLGGPAAASSTAGSPTRCPCCPAATSRRSCWPSGWPRAPSILIVDEPTRGIDVGTKADVHNLLDRLAGEGIAVLMISSELPEVLRLADRILVMREGRLVAEFAQAEASEESVMAAATGQLEAQAR